MNDLFFSYTIVIIDRLSNTLTTEELFVIAFVFQIVLSPLVSKGRGPGGIVTIVSLRMQGIEELWQKCSEATVSR